MADKEPENSGASSSQDTLTIVAIGASAGGMDALVPFFLAMPDDPGVAVVVVVHLDPEHASILPELLQKHTKMPVSQVEDGMEVQRNHVYVIPPNHDLEILNGSLQLMDPVRLRGAALPIDGFFRSLALEQTHRAIGIVLSGTGTDGTLGVRAIKGEGGMVMVQDEESATYDGMPRSVIATGLADYVLPPGQMPDRLIAYVKQAIRPLASTNPWPTSTGSREGWISLVRTRLSVSRRSASRQSSVAFRSPNV